MHGGTSPYSSEACRRDVSVVCRIRMRRVVEPPFNNALSCKLTVNVAAIPAPVPGVSQCLDKRLREDALSVVVTIGLHRSKRRIALAHCESRERFVLHDANPESGIGV